MKFTEKQLERIYNMSIDEFWTFAELNQAKITKAQFVELAETRNKISNEVNKLWMECETFDDGIRFCYDMNSDKMMFKKKKVLQALIDGKAPDEIGKDYWDILELFDKSEVEDGHTCIVGGWEYDPKKYK